ncbi:tyrosine-type recombinase/integrase [Tessaracoccus defluvii]
MLSGMARAPGHPQPDLRDLLTSWELSLRAERKSPQTVKSYGDGVRAFLAWAEAAEVTPELSRAQLRRFIDALLTDGARPSTAVSRHLAVRRFSAWLADEGEIPVDELLGVKAPKLDKPVIQPLTDEQLKALLKSCRGSDLRDKRDEAIIRLMYTTGMRAGEVVALRLSDLNLTRNPPAVIVRRGKGGKGRIVPLAPEVALAIDRYRRTRRTHRLADTDALWLGDRGKEFSYDALHKTLKMRATGAEIEGFHPHLLRHTAAHRWLERGGSEGGLMAVAGWSSPDMLQRYTRARAEERAITEAQSLNLGEL